MQRGREGKKSAPAKEAREAKKEKRAHACLPRSQEIDGPATWFTVTSYSVNSMGLREPRVGNGSVTVR